jgi:hypothetical protein
MPYAKKSHVAVAYDVAPMRRRDSGMRTNPAEEEAAAYGAFGRSRDTAATQLKDGVFRLRSWSRSGAGRVLVLVAHSDRQVWDPPRECPTLVWGQYEAWLAGTSPDRHKAAHDAYRKLNDINWRVVSRAGNVVPGAILQEGEGLAPCDQDRDRLSNIRGVIRNATEHLERFQRGEQ